MSANSVIYGVYVIEKKYTVTQVLLAFSLRIHLPWEVGCCSNQESQSQ